MVIRVRAIGYADWPFGGPERATIPELVETQGSRRAGAAASILHTTANPSRGRDCSDKHQKYGSYWESLPFVNRTHSGESPALMAVRL